MPNIEKARDNRLEQILQITEGRAKVLWGKVVERGIGLNFRVHGVHTRWMGPEQTVDALMPLAD